MQRFLCACFFVFVVLRTHAKHNKKAVYCEGGDWAVITIRIMFVIIRRETEDRKNDGMRYKLIGCKVFMRELYQLCAHSHNTVEIIWMREGLHSVPGQLRNELQKTIDHIEDEMERYPQEQGYDAILLGYGLCSMGVIGLHTRKLPLVVARAHDCITLLLGDRQRYRQLFDAHSGGVYWYSPGWIEQFKTAGRGRDEEEAKYAEYVEKYGEDNALYLLEVERSWTSHYECAAFIKWPELETHRLEEFARQAALENRLAYKQVDGSSQLLGKMIAGEWADDDVLVLKPGEMLAASNDDGIFFAQEACAQSI